jgi:DNA-binding NarL/FixJ family response regulator
MSKPKARILIADCEPIICEALAQLVARQSNLRVCGALTEGRKLIAAIDDVKPDLVLFDCTFGDCDSMELIRQLRVLFPKIGLLVLCSQPEISYAERCVRAGASGYIMKSETPQDLFDAIGTVLGGKMHLSTRMSALMLGKHFAPARPTGDSSGPLQLLTEREFRVFEFIGAGLRTREIAERLGRSVKTVEAHREHIKSKLNLRNASELAKGAAEWVRDNGTHRF